MTSSPKPLSDSDHNGAVKEATSPLPPKGTYLPAKSTDIRSPCPFINSLANHGHIPRDGRNLTASQLQAATISVGGISLPLAAALSNPIFLEHHSAHAEGDDQK